jgi:hypothetical protein
MSKYTPRPGDVATDLLRCFHASLKGDQFESSTFKVFLSHANATLPLVEKNLSSTRKIIIKRCIQKALNKKDELNHRRENLLTAATLLMHSSS